MLCAGSVDPLFVCGPEVFSSELVGDFRRCTQTPNLPHTTNQKRHDQCGKQHHSRKLLMIGIMMLEIHFVRTLYSGITCFLPHTACLFTQCHLLTYSMVQSPSWEANWFAASQEITCISQNPKVHYRTHKRPPPVSILGQPNPVHIPTSHLLEIHPNIIHPSAPRSPQWSLSLQFPQQYPIHPLSSHIRATCPANLILHLVSLHFVICTVDTAPLNRIGIIER